MCRLFYNNFIKVEKITTSEPRNFHFTFAITMSSFHQKTKCLFINFDCVNNFYILIIFSFFMQKLFSPEDPKNRRNALAFLEITLLNNKNSYNK